MRTRCVLISICMQCVYCSLPFASLCFVVGCDSGYYGDGCTMKCAEECIDGQCSPDTGLCDCNNDLVWNNGNCEIAPGL